MTNYYSQNGEDYLLSEMFRDKKDGFFVEVGCIDGRRFSNTLTFEERGWKGLCVEAHSGYIDLLRKNRPGSIVSHCAIGEEDLQEVTFYANSRGSLSTLDRSRETLFREHYGRYFTGFEEQRVPQKTLTTLFRNLGITDIDILSLDTEGSEIKALKGLDLCLYRPKALLVEAEEPEYERLLDEILVPRGYVKFQKVGGNILYVIDKRWAEAIKGNNIEVELIHTAHPLDAQVDACVKVRLNTGMSSTREEGDQNKCRGRCQAYLGYLRSKFVFWKAANPHDGPARLPPRQGRNKILERALSCRGWTDERKLSLLYDLTQKTYLVAGDILEIGSAWGRSTVLLGLASGKRIWSIDPHTGGIAYIRKNELQNSYDEFLANLARNNLADSIQVLCCTTEDVVTEGLVPVHVRFCLVFIDGLHTSEGVRRDLDFAYEHMADNGIIVLDDYFEPSVREYAAMIDSFIDEKKVVAIRDRDAGLVYFSRPG